MSANLSDRPTSGTPASGGVRHAATGVVTNYGAFRVILIVLAIWSFFEGFALFTGGLAGLSFGGSRSAQAAVGGHMIIMSALYALLAWQRERYRLLVWTPFAGQLALIIPTFFALISGNAHGLLLLIISCIFFVLLVYFWWERPMTPGPLPGDDDEAFMDEDDDASDASAGAGIAPNAPDPRRPARRFRRRD